MPGYVPRVGKVYVVALTASFAQVLTKAQARSIRGFKAKMRFVEGEAPPFFHLAFEETPSEGADGDGSGFYSISGSGTGDMAAPSNGLWCRVRDSGQVGKLLEIMTYG